MSSNPLPTPQVPKPSKPSETAKTTPAASTPPPAASVPSPSTPATAAVLTKPIAQEKVDTAGVKPKDVPSVSVTPPATEPPTPTKPTAPITPANPITAPVDSTAGTTPKATPVELPKPAPAAAAVKPPVPAVVAPPQPLTPPAPVPVPAPAPAAGPSAIPPVSAAPPTTQPPAPKPITVNPPKSMGPNGPVSAPPVSVPGAPPSAPLPKPTAPAVPPTLPKPPSTPVTAAPPTAPPPPPGGKPPVGAPPAPGAVPPAPATPPAGNAASAAPKQNPVFAAPKRSLMSFLPFVAIGVVVLAVLGWLGWRFLAQPKNAPLYQNTNNKKKCNTPANGNNQQRQVVPGTSTKITYWGLWEPSSVLTEVIKEFEQANPGVTVEYVQQSYKDYRERLQTAIASGTGPDLFRFHASWTPMLKNELSPVPSSVYSVNEFKDTFYPVALQQLQSNNQIVGVPLMYDGIALYYNKEILQTAGAKPPTTWAELRALAMQLTVRSGDQIQRGGLAIGNASNVEHFPEILGLLMLQNGADLNNPTSSEAKDALTFYTNFVRQDKVWDSRLPNSTVAFARGEAAMMFAPSWRAHEVKALNPDLDFAVVSVPKLSDTQLTWGTYWAEGVNNKSKNKDASWKFIDYLSSKEVQQRLYAEQSKVRSFGEPYSRKDLANQAVNDPYVAAYLSDAPYAQGGYLNSATHDNGINDQLIKYYTDAVNESLDGGVDDNVLSTLSLGTQQVLRQYGVSSSSSNR